MKEISARDLKARLDRGDRPFLLDVRQPEEFAESRVEGAVLIPLGELASRLGELDQSRELIVICRSGARSARACQLLEAQGFRDVTNLVGGNLAWQALGKS